ncbi:MAG: hypothetical protein EA360_00555 [Balneolaceae bacterium]|nr:MAG: hypothetical protein EA360_00555 [Balneolaceae bacterium]
MKTYISLLLMLLASQNLQAQFSSDRFEAGGYIQMMPVRIAAELPPPLGDSELWELRLQNRLNTRWNLSDGLTLNAHLRTRLFYGDLIRQIPGYAEGIDSDTGIVHLSFLLAEENSWLVHTQPDRLNIDWNRGDWRITAGRQRINWGINSVTNPNDLFNIYSFYEFDYPERPGSDAVRIQYFRNWASRIELAWRPARELSNSVAAALFAFNTGGYDVQMISGYYRGRLAAGGGWAGSIRQSGFKGEMMLFTDLEKERSPQQTTLIAGLSADHMFGNGLFMILEGLYNSAAGLDNFSLLGGSFAPDNPGFSRWQLSVQGSYPLSPILDGSLAFVLYPDQEALFVSPSVRWSVIENLDLNLLMQIFTGSSDSPFGRSGSVMAASLVWNF